MSATATAVPTQNVTTQEAKNNRLRYGKAGEPIPATRVLRKEMSNFSDPNTKAESWIILNTKTGTVTFANTYNGGLGKKTDWHGNTFALDGLDAKKHAKRMRGYTEVAISDCPVACKAE